MVSQQYPGCPPGISHMDEMQQPWDPMNNRMKEVRQAGLSQHTEAKPFPNLQLLVSLSLLKANTDTKDTQ